MEDHTICDKCEEEYHPEFESDYIYDEVSDIVCANAAMYPRAVASGVSRICDSYILVELTDHALLRNASIVYNACYVMVV